MAAARTELEGPYILIRGFRRVATNMGRRAAFTMGGLAFAASFVWILGALASA